MARWTGSLRRPAEREARPRSTERSAAERRVEPPATRSPGLAPTATLSLARRVDPATRARMVMGAQRALGNAHVVRLVADAQETTAPEAEPPVGADGGLVTRLLVALSAGRPEPVALVAMIEEAAIGERHVAYFLTWLREFIVARFAGDDTDLTAVLGALLAGTTYHPGASAITYQALDPAERQGVDTAINARFLAETGIARPLDWANPADRPLARRWLVLRDQLMDDLYDRPDRELAYADYLREGIEKLERAQYGRTWGAGVGADNEDVYQGEFWEEVRDEDATAATGKDVGMLRLKPGVSPAAAIDALFAAPEQWALDCAEFVQVAHLYAQRHSLGDLKFDQRVMDRDGTIRMALRGHGSTGLVSDRLYQREEPEDKLRVLPGDREVDASADELLAAAPVGSRVVWRNLAVDPDDPNEADLYNENAVKLGPDEFAAHGLGEKTVMTRAELELALARATWDLGGDPDQTEIEANIFIRSIQHIAIP